MVQTYNDRHGERKMFYLSSQFGIIAREKKESKYGVSATLRLARRYIKRNAPWDCIHGAFM